MSLIERCPNGHRVKVAPRHFGHRVRCPKCQAVFVVSPPTKRELTESSVLRILGDYSPDEAQREEARRQAPLRWNEVPASTRSCPRCHKEIAGDLRICPHCWVYLAEMPDVAAG